MTKIITNLSTLMLLAVDVGKTRLSGDPVNLKEAEKKLRVYENLIEKSDKVLIHMTFGQLS
jgi:hypothetical protein